jgi:hypothetical protein
VVLSRTAVLHTTVLFSLTVRFCAFGVVLLCCAFRAVVTFTRKATGQHKDALLSATGDT